ncbi:Rieske (2Fe-2S) protein [Streptomyces sp. NPDC057909]|uniref:Rieske (2Fe-2S) protein n=1 Tax=Streptomyces sp. NPDC057909 TaxID=3346277 RepID=UPI0036F074E3
MPAPAHPFRISRITLTDPLDGPVARTSRPLFTHSLGPAHLTMVAADITLGPPRYHQRDDMNQIPAPATPEEHAPQGLTRRSMVTSTAAAAAAVGTACLLAGCGKRKEREGAVHALAASANAELARLDEIPENGGLVVDHAKVVLTRNKKGELRAFSAVCTHAGCTVASVSKGEITCPCHGSRFDAETGRPLAGPAKKPLPPVSVKVHNGIVTSG